MPLSKLKAKKGQVETSGPDASVIAAQKRENDKKEMVMKRLRKAKHLKDCSEQHGKMAMDLSNETRMKQEYFGYLSRCAEEAVEEVRRERGHHRGGIRNTQEQKSCMRSIHNEAHRVKAVEVKLAFRTLSTPRWQRVAQLIHKYVKNFEYGAFHAAIIIGDTVLEWNDSSLVIPRQFTETEWAFWSSVHVQDPESTTTMLSNPVPVRATDQVTNEHFECIVQKIDGIRKEKELLIEALVETAVRYNTKLHYDVLSNNCQHFVRDCLSVIGIPGDVKYPFEGKLKELADLLVKDGAQNTVSSDFATHEELSSYVKSNLEETTQADMEYCICLYHLFHAFMEEEGEFLDEMCQETNLAEERRLRYPWGVANFRARALT